jgi:hypothetical protein
MNTSEVCDLIEKDLFLLKVVQKENKSFLPKLHDRYITTVELKKCVRRRKNMSHKKKKIYINNGVFLSVCFACVLVHYTESTQCLTSSYKKTLFQALL